MDIYWLDRIQQQDRNQVGEKAFHLSKIMQRGYSVIPGFVVPAKILRIFLETLSSNDALVADLPYSSLHLNVDNWRQLQQVADNLCQEIVSAPLPPQLLSTMHAAVQQLATECLIFRPSLIVPAIEKMGKMSGLYESIYSCCEEEDIALALKKSWSQLFHASSLLYWRRADIDLREVKLAVLVQPLSSAIASGILDANSSGWEIRSTWGLGISIYRGEVQPDVHYIQRETGEVRESYLGNKTIAYGCNPLPTATQIQTSDRCSLLPQMLKDQQHYALPDRYLQQLIEIASGLDRELGKNFTMKWTISADTPDGELSLTKITTPQDRLPDSMLIKGLAAATGQVTATTYVIVSEHKPGDIPPGVILVAPKILPNWLPMLQNVVGIITEKGGMTSHGAILSREFGIPAVVSAANATTLIQNGEKLLIDGDKGEIYRMRLGAERELTIEQHRVVSDSSSKSQMHVPITATQLLVNLSQFSSIKPVLSKPVDGVGLLRSELMALSILSGRHPKNWLRDGRAKELHELWTAQIIEFASAFAPRPIFYRSLDWRSHELPSVNHVDIAFPQSVLGDRGTFSYLENPDVFELELNALVSVQKAGYSNINLILPFVRSVEEFLFCRRKVEDAGLTRVSSFQLWIMAEVPSVLVLLPEYIKAGVQGISIGTNDLTQLLLGVDREHGQLVKAFDELHPAVMGAIAQLIQMAKSGGIACSICGQAPSQYPEIIDHLVRWGIDSISVEPEALDRTYQAIARAEQRILLAAAREKLQ